jgi:hypothetical protein
MWEYVPAVSRGHQAEIGERQSSLLPLITHQDHNCSHVDTFETPKMPC